MKEKYLGDSYDLVKRFFSQVLDPIARLYAYPKFVPDDIVGSYEKVTTIPILPETGPGGRFGILLDPDTGVRLPAKVDDTVHHVSPRHVTLQFIVDLNIERHPEYMICFDQSHHRKHEHSREDQRKAKMEFLRTHGIPSFYYASHAPFLFASQKSETLRLILERLMSVGIPGCRFEPCEISK
jgi:hypothetical protein